MKLERARYQPGQLLAFYEEAITQLGGLCERTWHDRLQIVADGRAAMLWRSDGALQEIELRFAPGDATSARDASREVFPGCPLTFRLAEALRVSPLPLERFVLPDSSSACPPGAVLEKLWRADHPHTTRWQFLAPPRADFHFSLLALARCEIQAIDQHWSLHRVALSLSDGEADEAMAREIAFNQSAMDRASQIAWPAPDPPRWRRLLQQALEHELESEMKTIRARQESSLRRELERIDEYFENYQRELTARATRSSSQSAKVKTKDRLAAARAEHERRRADQLARHQIRVVPHLDGLVLLAERAWKTELSLGHQPQTLQALFVPRLRRWKLNAPNEANQER